jgi:hypothetical protein
MWSRPVISTVATENAKTLGENSDMKMTIEIDCTPEEARRLVGLPDVTKANEIYVENLTNLMKSGSTFEQLDQISTQFAPMGQAGLKLIQQFLEAGTGAALKGKK